VAELNPIFEPIFASKDDVAKAWAAHAFGNTWFMDLAVYFILWGFVIDCWVQKDMGAPLRLFSVKEIRDAH
jgi:hypothetical protein